MNNKFHPGQKIICVEKNGYARVNEMCSEQIFLGETYIVEDTGIYKSVFTEFCYVRVNGMITMWNQDSFAPIEDQYEDITAEIAKSMTQTKETPDKVVIPETVNN